MQQPRILKRTNIESQIDTLLDRAHSASHGADVYPHLPEIIVSLEVMRNRLRRGATDPRSRARMAGLLRRLVDHSEGFAQSELGHMLLDLASDFVFDWTIHNQ